MRSSLLGVLLGYGLRAPCSVVADEGIQTVSLAVPPASPFDRSALAKKWHTARTVLQEDFDSQPVGSYPTGWRFSLRNPYNQAADHQVAAVALTQDGGQVLRIRRTVRTRWTEDPGRGQLRPQYDYYQLPNSNGVTMISSIIDLRARHRSSIQPRNKVHSGCSAGRVVQLHRRVKSPHSTTTTLARTKAVLPPTHGIAS